jgi:TetR/AcrR family transcriptional regulator
MVDSTKRLVYRARMRPSRPRGAAADAGRTRRALLEAGTAVFAERGFKGATAELIAQRAAVNKAMINYHFRSKKGLYQAILTDTLAALLTRLQAVRVGRRPAPEQLCEFIAAFGDRAREHPAFPAMLMREVLSGGEQLDPAIFTSLSAVFGLVRDIVAQGTREGSFRKVDPLLTHLSIVGALLFFFGSEPFRRRVLAEVPLARRAPRAASFVAHMQEAITRGLAPDAPARRKR